MVEREERREKHARRERPAAKHKSPTLTLSDLFPLFRAIAKFLGAAGADKVAPLVTEHVNIMIYDFCVRRRNAAKSLGGKWVKLN